MTRTEAIEILTLNYSPYINGNSEADMEYNAKQKKALDMAINSLKMSDDCISRQTVLDEMMLIPIAPLMVGDGVVYKKGVLEGTIKALPSVTPKPKTGHWIGIDEEPHEDYECDNCGYAISTWTANIKPHEEYKFCPNCGAKMVEPQESER